MTRVRPRQEWDLNNDTQIEECLRHSDTVYNLVGRDYKTKSVSPGPLLDSQLSDGKLIEHAMSQEL